MVEHICSQFNRVPARIQVDNGSEFISKVLDQWAYESQVNLVFSRPGKSTDNTYIELFNGIFRVECLNLHWFLSLPYAQERIETWRQEYYSFRPHSSLGYLTPNTLLLSVSKMGGGQWNLFTSQHIK